MHHGSDEQQNLIKQASQYYERLKANKPCDVVHAVITIRNTIRLAGCRLSILEPMLPEDEAERHVKTFLESKLGKTPTEQKSGLVRDALELYGMLKSGHRCDIAATLREIHVCINHAGVSLAALEPEIPEDRRKEVEARIEKYFERLESTQSNDPGKNPPPDFTHAGRHGRTRKDRFMNDGDARQHGGGGR